MLDDFTRLEIARYEGDDPAEWLSFVVTAHDHLVGWLRSVGAAEVGILAAG